VHKLILSFKGKIQKVHIPKGVACSIGRAHDCDISIDNLAVEPLHATIHLMEHEASLSTHPENRVLVNNMEPANFNNIELRRGDEISIGKHIITYLWETELTGKEEPSTSNPPRQTKQNGWLQIMNGPKMGRTLQLNKANLQIGAADGKVALITNRQDGYYLSVLDNDVSVTVDNHDIGDNVVPLQNGNTISVGDMEMLFFIQE
jgi:predicted component of type VI protein secretion system